MFISGSGKKLYRYYKEKELVFRENYCSITDSITEQNSHDLRVSIKRMRALFALMELINADFNAKKRLKHYKKIFKPVGKIRELKVNLKTLEAYDLSPELMTYFLDYSNGLSNKHTENLKDKLEKFNHLSIRKNRKLVKNLCQTLEKKVIKHKSIAFIQNRIETINGLASSTEISSIHDIRKKLKEISAVVYLLNKIKLSGFDDELLNQLKSTEDLIGDWHDKEILLEFIQDFLTKANTTEQVRSEFQTIKNKIIEENNNFVNSLEEILLKTLDVIDKPILEKAV